ncbi:MAG: adenosylmethionine--8-amino-7-oxononanoate transaminase [Phycisphaerae bacterium]|nr:adenosylmethionine--8-amino-7-oxononanoate transaminase [Phycisphaerae bacterium]
MTSPLRIWHPFTNAAVDAPPLHAVRAEGAYIYTADGRKILDAVSSWWVNIHGHGNPRIAAAIAEQARKLEHVILAGFTHDAAEELAARLGARLPAELRHMFFSDDGSTAVEVALKLAVQYFSNQGRVEKSEIVALEHAYHGDTAGAMAVSDDSPFTAPFNSMRYRVHRVHSAYCHQCPVGLTRDTCHIECVNKLEILLQERAGRIAAVIVEPLLQAAGGMIVHPVEFLQKVRALCTQHDVLLIADEVLTGFGRSGKMFACELAEVVPDLMCLSKGITGGFLPMGATVCTDQVEAPFRSQNRMHTFYHGHSYTGNALACAAAVASLKIFDDEPVFERISAIAGVHTERLEQLRGSPKVGDVRQIGSIGAVELRTDDSGYLSSVRTKLYKFFLDHDVLLRPLGNVIYVLPPYVASPEEIDHVYDVIGQAIETVI